MEKPAIKAFWLRKQWFRDLPQEVIAELIEMSSIRSLVDGQVLYAKNDPPEGFYGVLEGAIRVGACSAEGKHVVYTILKAGSWLGEISLFDGQHRMNNADALGATKILFVSRANFNELLDRQPWLYVHFLKLVCLRFRGVVALMEDRCLRGYQERLASKLVQLVDQHGIEGDEGIEIDLRLPQEELAFLVGTTRQRINKFLKDWEKENLISVKYSRITIKDSAALERLVSPI